MINFIKTFIVVSSIISVLIFAGCNNQKVNNNKKEIAKQEIINTDKEFYNISQKIGTGNAFIKFADDSTILMRDGKFPIFGKKEVINSYLGKETDITPLKWNPVKADVSDDGTLGYSFGKWEFAYKNSNGKDTTLYGVYVTIWKKQSDNTWKYILDGGNQTPPPNENKN